MTVESPTPIQRSSFSTRQLAPGHRIDGWRESISTLFDITAAPQSDNDDFNASVNSFLINNQVILSHCDTKAQRFERRPFKVANDKLDYYMIQTHLTGSQVMQVGSREVECRPGELMIIDLAEQHDAITTDFTQLTLVVPRQLLSRHLLHPDSQEGRVLKADMALARLAVNHMKTLYSMLGGFSQAEALQIIEPTLLLMASALNGSMQKVENGGAGVAVSLLAAAKVHIERNLHGALSADSLCAALGYSRSTLYRLFEPLGGVRAYIQERRLRRSAEALLADQHRHRRICDIAYNWGFVSEAHYSRAFRQRYDMSPTDARQARSLLKQKQASIMPAQVGDRDYEQWVVENLRL